MSVPKFRNSRSRVRRRRAHHALKPVRVAVDEETGELKLPHHVTPSTVAKVKTDKLTKEIATEMDKKEAEKPIKEVKAEAPADAPVETPAEPSEKEPANEEA